MTPCEEGLRRYQARQNITVLNEPMVVWETRCLPMNYEVGTLVLAGYLVAQADDGSFPDPVVIPQRCCGR